MDWMQKKENQKKEKIKRQRNKNKIRTQRNKIHYFILFF